LFFYFVVRFCLLLADFCFLVGFTMLDAFEKEIKDNLQNTFKLDDSAFERFNIAPAPGHIKNDLSISWPIASARILKMPPMEIAKKVADGLSSCGNIDSVAVAPPGFVNINLKKDFLLNNLNGILSSPDYFKNPDNSKQNINIEFVSANPTGPLHLASGSAATLGDSLIRILKFLGYRASSEFYVNDMGKQVDLLGQSLKARFFEEDIPENGYQGDYLKDISLTLPSDAKTWTDKQFSDFALKKMIALHREDMKGFGVEFDRWFLETELKEDDAIEKVKEELKNKNLSYEKEGALWFGSLDENSSEEDQGRALIKSDGRNTYFLSDIAYHLNKFKRGFTRLIDIWGADHHGYIPRMKAAMSALNKTEGSFEVIIHQLVSLKIGDKIVKMSKRKGEFISLKELTADVGKDACRFFFAMRSPNTHLIFDVELAKTKSNENPVFYVQYVHARICSIFAKAQEMKFDVNALPDFNKVNLNDKERELINKIIWLEKVLNNCANELTPHHLTTYLMELSGLFHSFYDKHKVVDESNPETTQLRLFILRGIKFVINEGLNLIGVSAPEKM
ncbi:MAG: arginine--tRNA ligase, partial [Elusimicrobia bacterium]|nr:arginine--tRNA ligase [Elusimicrobiota bacterium]